MKTEPIRIVAADDHPLVLAGVKATLAEDPSFKLLAEAKDGTEAWRACLEHRPDVLLLDLEMPGMQTEEILNSLDGQPDLNPKVVILTANQGADMFHRIKTRIHGYLVKDEVGQELAYALRAVHLGAVWFTQKVAWQVQAPKPEEDELLRELTPREREVLSYIAQGLDNQAIAQKLHLAEQTVRNYASTVYDKLDFGSRAAAVVWARERGLVKELN